ncbi:NupC/NupG family nucleoside CNT transporter [Paraferrimonas sp. SM1919]|uniref:NupC/NupG family nucleoside CNT transporter n=1 Tax=Paraferrimonas sp. SM1919 TaxID=2662263 RepID=UPI0013D3DE34|nr:NupC/NupG family nucleoside CNT transporter [Paraferrimonas sp. SM1919]
MVSILGMFAIIALAVLLSSDKKSIPLRTVVTAFALQIAFALLVLYVPAGKAALGAASEAVNTVVGFGAKGIQFLFGDLAAGGSVGFVFAVNVLGTIIFFSALVSTLYYLRIMPLVINGIGAVLHKVLGTSRVESLSATANIFVGMVEAPLVVKPYVKTMTDSQLFAMMTCGLASVAGATMVGYASVGVELEYLIAAAFMSAPAGLLMAKILVPPSKDEQQDKQAEAAEVEEATNVVEAIANGAMSGYQVAVGVGVSLLAFVGMIALLDALIGTIAGVFGAELSLGIIFGYVFAPVAWLIGVPWSEAMTAGSLIGTKMMVNEFVAFIELMNVKDQLSAHSQAIVTFALCGFANISSMGMLIGSLGTLVPERRQFVAKYGFKAIAGGVLANLMSAALAGVILSL